jgi:hypothetical protein
MQFGAVTDLLPAINVEPGKGWLLVIRQDGE